MNTNMIHLRNYFCLELITGGMVIGWIGLANSLILILTMIKEFYDIDDFIIKKNFDENSPLTITDIHSIVKIVFIICLVFTIINGLTSLLLIIGVFKRRSILLLPWLIEFGFNIIFSPLLMIAGIIFISVSMKGYNTVVHGIVLIDLMLMVISIYSWLAIYTLYRQFKSDYTSHRIPEAKQLEANF